MMNEVEKVKWLMRNLNLRQEQAVEFLVKILDEKQCDEDPIETLIKGAQFVRKQGLKKNVFHNPECIFSEPEFTIYEFLAPIIEAAVDFNEKWDNPSRCQISILTSNQVPKEVELKFLKNKGKEDIILHINFENLVNRFPTERYCNLSDPEFRTHDNLSNILSEFIFFDSTIKPDSLVNDCPTKTGNSPDFQDIQRIADWFDGMPETSSEWLKRIINPKPSTGIIDDMTGIHYPDKTVNQDKDKAYVKSQIKKWKLEKRIDDWFELYIKDVMSTQDKTLKAKMFVNGDKVGEFTGSISEIFEAGRIKRQDKARKLTYETFYRNILKSVNRINKAYKGDSGDFLKVVTFDGDNGGIQIQHFIDCIHIGTVGFCFQNYPDDYKEYKHLTSHLKDMLNG